MASLEAVDVVLLVALVVAPAALLLGGFRLLAWLRDDGAIEQAQNAGPGGSAERRIPWGSSGGDRTSDTDGRRGGPDDDQAPVFDRSTVDAEEAVRCRACGTVNVAHATYCRYCLEEL